jgi:glycosyltransferase involved in cell wall biosynthesis
MKIAYVCSSLSLGGLELNHLRNALWMQARGHDVVMYAPQESPLFQKALDSGLHGIPITHQRKYYAWSAAISLARSLKKEQVSHVFIRDNRDMSMIATVKVRMGKSIITAYFMEMQLGVKKTGILHSIRFKSLDYWFCPLFFLEKQVIEWTHISPSKVHLVPSGIDRTAIKRINKEAARRQLELPLHGFTFGLVGRFDLQKGQLLVLDALHRCTNAAINLVFLGEPTRNETNHVMEKMETFIKEHHLVDRVFIRPFMQEVGVFYSALDALIMATKAETFGMVTLEAIAHGIPVVGSNAGGTPDLLHNETFGRLFEPLNAADLALRMNEMVSNSITFDQALWEQHVSRFDHHAVCKSIEQVVSSNT